MAFFRNSAPRAKRIRRLLEVDSRRAWLKGSDSVTRFLLAVLFWLSITAIVDIGWIPPDIRLGEVADSDWVARQDFFYDDVGATAIAREHARAGAPKVYKRSAAMPPFPRTRRILQLVTAGSHIGMKDVAALLKAEGIEADLVPFWKLRASPPKPDLRTEFLNRFDSLVQEEVAGILPDGVVAAEFTRMDVPRVLLLAAEKGGEKFEEVLILGGDKSAESAGKAVVGETDFRDMVRARVEEWYAEREEGLRKALLASLSAEIRLDLELDPAASEEAAKRAAKGVSIVKKRVRRGETFVWRGEEIDELKLRIIRAEHRANYNAMPLLNNLLRLGGIAMLSGGIILALMAGAMRMEEAVFDSTRKLFFFGSLNLLVVAIAKALSIFNLPTELIPVGVTSVLIGLVLGARFAVVATVALSILVGVVVGGDYGLVVSLTCGSLVALLVACDARRRSTLLKAGAASGVTLFAVIAGTELVAGVTNGAVIVEDAGWGLVNGLATGLVATGLLPLAEYAFGVTTNISLLELSDQNQPALRELLRSAPGTYHHSLVVGNLAEAAAEAVTADPLLCRVASYYHDIGKVAKPEYFVENEPMGISRHDNLSPQMSVLIITSHVKDGVEMAKTYRVPRSIVEIIEQHHGTTRVEFFFHKALEAEKARRKGLDRQPPQDSAPMVDEALFRYQGPKPQSREAGIVLVADSVDAASRTLTNPSPKRIRTLVEGIAMSKLLSGQFDECELTFRDLREMSNAFTRVLTAMFHGRKRYPSQEV